LSSIYEKIDHKQSFPAKIFVARLESSRLHWHYDYELLVVLKGSLQIYSGPAAYTANTGDIVLFNSKVIHGLKGLDTENLCLFIQFPPSLFEHVLSNQQLYYFDLNSVNKIFPPKISYRHFVDMAVHIGISGRQSGSAADLRTHALLLTLAADLVEYTEYDIRSIKSTYYEDLAGEKIAQICLFIDSNLQDKDLVTKIIDTFATTEKTLYRHLKNTTGLTLKDLIDTARIEKSKQLLRETDKHIPAILDECGFSNEVTFYRVFKKETGRTPKEFRQRGSSPFVEPKVQGYLRFNEKNVEQVLHQYVEAAAL
jgi:AraC-like DNA-binding protein/mannose-6-phosphate isomerase-like protein (cupin superfamily)